MTFEDAKEYAKVRAVDENTRMAIWSHRSATGEFVLTVSDDRIAQYGCRHQGSVSAQGVYSSE